MNLPLLRWRRWDLNLDVATDYQYADADAERTYGTFSKLALQWVVPSTLGFYSWREFQLSLQNRFDLGVDDGHQHHNTSQAAMQYTHGFHQSVFARGFASYAWGQNRDVDVRYFPYVLLDEIQVSRLTDHGDYLTRQAGALRLEISKALTVPQYSARIPLGLNRIAPLVVGQGTFMDIDSNHLYPNGFFEWGWGADFELLVLHLFPVRLRYLAAYDTNNPGYKENQFQLVYKQEF
jgi:hypothetical protein